MSASRRPFAPRPLLWVRVTPQGFLFRETEETVAALEGHVVKQRLRRKLFLDGMPACSSPDGVASLDGKIRCDDCRHPICLPQIRLQIADRHAHYLLDLAISSMRNFLDLEAEIQAQGLRLESRRLRLTMINRGHWGEVRFERID